MNGRISQYRGGHTRAPAGSSKWTHKDDRVDKGKRVNEYMCITNKDKSLRPHCESYDRYDAWRDKSSVEPCTPEEQRNPFYNPQKQPEFDAKLKVEGLKYQHECEQRMENNQNETNEDKVPQENYESLSYEEIKAQFESQKREREE